MGRKRKGEATVAKTQSGRLSRPPYAMPLDTIGNVRRELGRLYRASLSGKLESAEAARLAFILKEVRASLEVERELHLDGPQSRRSSSRSLVCRRARRSLTTARAFVWADGVPCTAPRVYTVRTLTRLDRAAVSDVRAVHHECGRRHAGRGVCRRSKDRAPASIPAPIR